MSVRTFRGGEAINFFIQNPFQIILSNFLFWGEKGQPPCLYALLGVGGCNELFYSEFISDHLEQLPFLGGKGQPPCLYVLLGGP